MNGLRRPPPAVYAAAVLIALWLLFYWRLLTPISADQASLKQGDFSGQFAAFAAYQAERFAAGEIPLWNPYNNGGLPFLADTQAAVFYPPRWLTIALLRPTDASIYRALQLEMTAHALAYTLLMFIFARRLTGSIYGGLIAALIAGYGGFITGYAPLQLAILEAAVWLPLAALGILQAANTRRFRPAYLLLTSFALGMSWLAGHPQTSFLLTTLLAAYFAYRVWSIRASWQVFVGGAALFGGLAGGLAAVQLVPGIEYLAQTTRTGFGYDAKGNGFPIQDVIQFIYPHVVSQWSPLYVGVIGIVLAWVAWLKRSREVIFWTGAALFALAWSFGANAALYPMLYNLLPGLRFFRGQERAAYIVNAALALLAGFGAAQIIRWDALKDYALALRLRVGLHRAFLLALLIMVLIVIAWIGSRAAYDSVIQPTALSTLIFGAALLILPTVTTSSRRTVLVGLLTAALVFELFSANFDHPATYDPVPPEAQLPAVVPPLIAHVQADTDGVFRVDGVRGVLDNYGSLYNVQDIRGISPLFYDRAWTLIGTTFPNAAAWEAFAVRYVYTDWAELPIPSQIVGADSDRYGAVNLHRLADPRPFAQVMTQFEIIPDDAAAQAWLRDWTPNARATLILNADPGIPPRAGAPQPADMIAFAPERVVIRADAPATALLSVALIDYPGWRASVDGSPTPILRAYGIVSAVVIPAGTHEVEFVYDPLSFKIGAVISAAVWAALGIGVILLVRRRAFGTMPMNHRDDVND